MPKLKTIELDTTELDSDFLTWLYMNNIRAKIIEEVGPAGGNPLVEYTGPPEAIKLMIKEWFGGDGL